MNSLLPSPAQQTAAITQSDDVVVEAVCRERRGVVKRQVRKLLFTMDNLNKFWERSSKYPVLFSEEISGDFKKFLELFLYQIGTEISVNGLFWVIDDFVGVYYLNHIVVGVDAQVHYSFFDGAQNGREELTKKMLAHVFEKYNFNRLSCAVPCYASPSTANFVERLGFKFEGKKRKSAFYNNEWFDVRLYGLLKENHLNGNAN
jgi:RimJ/RimL family protein N-acetyltransferase